MILVLNAGSASLKFGLFDHASPAPRMNGTLKSHDELADLLRAQKISPQDITAVGHRVVHGGERFRAPVRITPEVIEEIERLSPLSPLHNPPALRMIKAAQRVWPHVPHVAVFDTAFFASLPESRVVYPLPYEWYADWGIRRFGFHGISHAYCAQRAAAFMSRETSDFGVIVCHLGGGSSAAAIENGPPIATTMGFTPLEGLMMGTRSGSVDPGILFYLMKEKGLTPTALEDALEHRAGLKGVSGISEDMRAIEQAAQTGNSRAQLALALYADRLRSAIGSLAVLLERLDAIVFTGGIGENSITLRATVSNGLRSLGVVLDSAKNRNARSDIDIAADRSAVRLLVIHTREEECIARAVSSFES